MKAAGYLCRIDALGRVVIPKQLRKQFGLEDGVCMELFTTESQIIMQKYQPGCVFCNNVENLTELNGKCICKDCLGKLNEQQ
ncbi:MAG: AbrB family transcriptional regulator [Ruminococcus sp.]|nr:AbrB family transcriptional regulator [Ruminococcus sp.]